MLVARVNSIISERNPPLYSPLIVESHIQRIGLATEETAVTQQDWREA